MAGFDVDIKALRQWAAMVERQKGYLEQTRNERAAQITDGDFGVVMDMISGPYTDLLPKVEATLAQAVTQMGNAASALTATADDYADRDGKTTDRFVSLNGGR